jgi:hypothetical protein
MHRIVSGTCITKVQPMYVGIAGSSLGSFWLRHVGEALVSRVWRRNIQRCEGMARVRSQRVGRQVMGTVLLPRCFLCGETGLRLISHVGLQAHETCLREAQKDARASRFE